MNSTIALLTDFGISDTYVGVMKAVMRHIFPQVNFIDLTHEIEPQNVRQAAFALLNSLSYFAPGTVFLVVVDPGVGTTRRPIAVRAGDYLFVAPDNGILTYALDKLAAAEAVELTNPIYHLQHVSATFHGRDVFAPVAAHLASGILLEQVGSPIDKLTTLPAPELKIEKPTITGEIIHIDHFGNIVTSIGQLHWVGAGRLRLHPYFADEEQAIPVPTEDIKLTLHGHTLHNIRQTYGEGQRGELLALVGSSGYLEVAVNQGSAAARLNAEVGDRIQLTVRPV